MADRPAVTFVTCAELPDAAGDETDTGWAYALAVVMAVNSVIALAYYANVAKEMWMNAAPDGDTAPVRVPVSLSAALVITAGLTLVFGVTAWATDLGDAATFVASVVP